MTSQKLCLLANYVLFLLCHFLVLCHTNEHSLFLLNLWDQSICLFTLYVCEDLCRNFAICAEYSTDNIGKVKGRHHGQSSTCANSSYEKFVSTSIHGLDLAGDHRLNFEEALTLCHILFFIWYPVAQLPFFFMFRYDIWCLHQNHMNWFIPRCDSATIFVPEFIQIVLGIFTIIV